jgi:hypothetical protein
MADKTPKKKELFPSELMTKVLYQSNRVTAAVYDFTLLQEKIFTWVMYYLQEDLLQVANNKTTIGQLALFNEDPEFIRLHLDLCYIGKPHQYDEIREAAKEITRKSITIKDHTNTKEITTGLFSVVVSPTSGNEKKYSGKLGVMIHKRVAAALITTEKNSNNKIANYTSYMLYICAVCKNKYTSRIYKLLSRFADRGGYNMELAELRKLLCIGENSYQNFADFKRAILVPVSNELKQYGDIWFNCADPEFLDKQGKKVKGIRFKIVVPLEDKKVEVFVNWFRWFAKDNFQAEPRHIEAILKMLDLNKWTNFAEITEKIEDVDHYIKKHSDKVKYPGQYLQHSIQTWIAAKK